MAYMDNTQWLSESKDNLEKILEIADDFYNFTDIQVNKQKSELLLRIQNPNFKYNDDIQLNFENQQIAIKPVHQSQSVRILGVWFNMNCSQRYVIDQIKEEILKLALSHNFKGILVTHPSFENNIKGWTVFWVDHFNSPYFGKIIKKDIIKKKIYVQHFLLSRQNNSTFFDPCHGLFIDSGSESCSMSFGFAQACDLSPKHILVTFEMNLLTLNVENMKNIHYTLNWNNIEVEQSPRKFISQASKVKGFEEFFNLARNVKYRRTNIDWKSTFEVLSDDDPSNITTFKSSRRKAEKIKFLMEKLPTIEQMKKSLLDIYDNWLCPICSDVIEDFNHIWLCVCHVNILQKIVRDSQHFILTVINNNIKSDFCHVSLTDINSLDNFWNWSIDNNCLTFIDFIKGFIPITLSNNLKSLFFNDKVVCTIIGDLHEFTYNEGKFAIYNGTITGEGRMYLCLSEKQGDIGDKQRLCFHVLSCICRRIGNKNQIKKINTWARSGEDPSQYARDPQEENLEKARLILSHMKRSVIAKESRLYRSLRGVRRGNTGWCREVNSFAFFTGIGGSMDRSVNSFNRCSGSLEKVTTWTLLTGRPKGTLEIRLEVGVEGEVILTFTASSETVHKRLFGTSAVLLGDKGQSSEGAEVSGGGDSGISGLITEGAGGVVIV
ncbi:hypothetical protein RhiirA1_400242 [Rhizophagus irregularis]|uniref:Reverse transcriptase domain-containing protein n=1 Tax=Rhizophagus irregularis TaxID=588596 RepID=A0A2N0R6W0_9GLOM|nr:hypothetical protein RhiirA1_400242 [Rhizophagus irregularis]